jgi:hypothetical protein
MDLPGFYHDSSPKFAELEFLTECPQALTPSFAALTTTIERICGRGDHARKVRFMVKKVTSLSDPAR